RKSCAQRSGRSWPNSLVLLPSPTRFNSLPGCPKHAPERSCAGSFARSPKVTPRTLATCRHSLTRRSSSKSRRAPCSVEKQVKTELRNTQKNVRKDRKIKRGRPGRRPLFILLLI